MARYRTVAAAELREEARALHRRLSEHGCAVTKAVISQALCLPAEAKEASCRRRLARPHAKAAAAAREAQVRCCPRPDQPKAKPAGCRVSNPRAWRAAAGHLAAFSPTLLSALPDPPERPSRRS